MFRSIGAILILILAAAAVYRYRDHAYVYASQLYELALPCTRPIPYAIGTIDPRFHLSTSSVLADMSQATSIWNQAASTTLFVNDPTHAILTVNFVYDNRQETTDKLSKLGLTISDDKASYDAVKAKYTSLYAKYQSDKAAFDAAHAAFEADEATYEAEVQEWNAKGGAPSTVYQHLSAERDSLRLRQSELQKEADAVNTEADSVNALVDELNRLASGLTIDASAYNSAGGSLGDEFEEGVFESQPGHEEIDIYEFDSQAQLVRVLAHEFGHSLGLDHVTDPKAIMYALNQSKQTIPTASDIAELDRACRR